MAHFPCKGYRITTSEALYSKSSKWEMKIKNQHKQQFYGQNVPMICKSVSHGFGLRETRACVSVRKYCTVAVETDRDIIYH